MCFHNVETRIPTIEEEEEEDIREIEIDEELWEEGGEREEEYALAVDEEEGALEPVTYDWTGDEEM